MFTTDDMQAFGIGARGQILKNLFLRDAKGKRHFLVVTASEKKADLDALREALGSTRLSFGSAERLMRCLHTTQGSVSPFAVLHDRDNAVEVVFDKALAALRARERIPATTRPRFGWRLRTSNALSAIRDTKLHM